MPDTITSVPSRKFGRTDGKRAVISAAIIAVAGAGYWFMLPVLQSMIIPDAAGGANGPWVVRPILASHFGAVAVMAGVTVPFIIGPLKRKWDREDAAVGSRYDPFAGRPVKRTFFMLKGALLLIVYAAALVAYLFSWDKVGPEGIERHLPWGTERSSFQEVAFLDTIPDGERSDSLKQNGPWYSVQLRGDRRITWSLDNEGIGRGELTAMTAFVANRSGQTWTRRGDARAR